MQIKTNILKNNPIINGLVYDIDDLVMKINDKIQKNECFILSAPPESVDIPLDRIMGSIKSFQFKDDCMVLEYSLINTTSMLSYDPNIKAKIAGSGCINEVYNSVVDYNFMAFYIN